MFPHATARIMSEYGCTAPPGHCWGEHSQGGLYNYCIYWMHRLIVLVKFNTILCMVHLVINEVFLKVKIFYNNIFVTLHCVHCRMFFLNIFSSNCLYI